MLFQKVILNLGRAFGRFLRSSGRRLIAQASFSNVTSLVSVTVVICGTSATIYYNFFWNRESLHVNYAIGDIATAEYGELPSRFMFSNTGKQAAVVDDVILVEIVGEKVGLQDCASSTIAEAMSPKRRSPDGSGGVSDKRLKIIEPTSGAMDNGNSMKRSVLVEPNNVKLLALNFRTEKLSKLETTRIVYCFVVTYYDRLGSVFTRPISGWMADVTKSAGGSRTIWYSFSPNYERPVQLLPMEGYYVRKGYILGTFIPGQHEKASRGK